VSTTIAAQTASQLPRTSLDTNFQSGGKIRMQLAGGDYKIEPSPDNKIHINWHMKETNKLKDVRVTADVRDKDAVIRTSGPHNVSFVIQVPSRSGLYVRLMAGDLKIKDISGDKDIESHAGDVEIDVVDPESYRNVDASVNFGDLDASAFHVSKGGIARSFKSTGHGEYLLHAHVGAGDLRLYSNSDHSHQPNNSK
jgi:DUF4097 and DUF4098 domain-containing protein YvlB